MAILSQMSDWQSKMLPFEEHSSTSGPMQVSYVDKQPVNFLAVVSSEYLDYQRDS